MTEPEQKPWQRGIPLARLKAFADCFKASNAKHVYGAFGLTKERDVADAFEKAALVFRGSVESPFAVAILKHLTRNSAHKDFTGRAVTLPAGAVLVSSVGYKEKPEEVGIWLAAFGDVVWAEVFQENQEVVGSLLQNGFTYVATKVAAGSEIKGLYAKGCATLAPLPSEESPSLACLYPTFIGPNGLADIAAEVESAAKWFADHYSGYNKRKSWQAMALRGYDTTDPGFIIKPAEMSKQWKADNAERLDFACGPTDLWHQMPVTAGLVESMPGKKDRVRFMRLRAGDGELARHADITDRDAGLADGKVTRLHIPIVTNPGAVFTGWDDRGCKKQAHMNAGGLWYLDQRKPHACVNGGGEDRIHLVVDTYGNERVRQMIRETCTT